MWWFGLKPESIKEFSRPYHESLTNSLHQARPVRSAGQGGMAVCAKRKTPCRGAVRACGGSWGLWPASRNSCWNTCWVVPYC